ncbi:reverse transcriptase domain-containing protein [Burkholderia sp. MR1-5-21]
MSSNDLQRLEALRKKNADPNWVNGELYRLMYKEDLYVVAYERLKSSPGNMTPGADGTTLDEFSLATIKNIVSQMRTESFQFSRARRVHIPKANGGKRPLGIASPKDKVVQEVMRMILEAIYESPYGPSFSEASHGFRPNRGCHTALKSIRDNWSGVSWVVEGDVKAAFDNIDHNLLIGHLKKRISDTRFLNLIRKALTAGYYEFRTPVNSDIGTPQGSIVSPILCNIFLHELDLFMIERIACTEKGEKRGRSLESIRAYKRLEKARREIERLAPRSEERALKAKEIKAAKLANMRVPSGINDGSFIRLKYVRYADDWCVGVNGPKWMAEQIRNEVRDFMKERLGLTLNMEKTHIRHAKTEEAFFLGTRIKIGSTTQKVQKVVRNGKAFDKRVTGWLPQLWAPVGKLVGKLHVKGFCGSEGEPTPKYIWVLLDDDQIVSIYGSVIRGLLNYYSFADNYAKLSRVQYILKYSAALTLATKHRLSLKQVFRKYGDSLAVFKQNSKGKTFGVSLPVVTDWSRRPSRFMIGETPSPDSILLRHSRMRTRSKLGESCAICGSDAGVQMHHVRHVRKMGDRPPKGFTRLLATLNRKQIPACGSCHAKIHAGAYDGLKLRDLHNPFAAAR